MEEGEVLDIEHFESRGEKRNQDDLEEEEDGTLSIKPPPVSTKKHKKHHKNKEEKRSKKHKKKRSKSKERNKDDNSSRSRNDTREQLNNRERNKDSSRRVKIMASGSHKVDTRISRPQRPKSRDMDDKGHASTSTHSHKFDQRRLGFNNDSSNRARGRYEEPIRERNYPDKSRGGLDYRRGGARDRRRDKPMLVRRIDDSEDNDRRNRSDGGNSNYTRDSRRRDVEYERDHHRSRSDNVPPVPRAEHRIQRVISPLRSSEYTGNEDTANTNSGNSESDEEEDSIGEKEDETQSDENATESLDEKDDDDEKAASSDDDEDSADEDESSGSEEESGNIRSKFDSSPEEEESVGDANEEEDQNEEDSSSQENEASDDNEEEEEEQQDPTPEPSPEVLKPDLPYYLPAIQGCRSVDEFQCLNRIEEGTYGVVYRAKDKKTQEVVALKRLKMEKEREGFPITSLREVCTLLKAHHPNIVKVQEIVVGSNMDKIYIVMDYVEHDMKSLMETMKQPFLIGEVKTLMIQLLRGVHHLHDNWILHRDLKTSNLLLSHNGILKIGDFGLAREYGSPLKPYTPIVVTLWYRAPELLLGCKKYSTQIDAWSVGCIFAEFLTLKPLFPGKSEIIQLNLIFKELGTPSERIWPGYNELPIVKKATFTDYPYNKLRKRFDTRISEKGMDLLNSFLTYCPSKRSTCWDALSHKWFKETPLPVDPAMFPTWPAKSEQSKAKKVGHSPKAPEGGMGYDKLLDKEDKMGGFQLTAPKHGLSKQGMGFKLKF